MKQGQLVITAPQEGFNPLGRVLNVHGDHVIVESLHSSQCQWICRLDEVAPLLDEKTRTNHPKWLEHLSRHASWLTRGLFRAHYAFVDHTISGVMAYRVEDGMLFSLSHQEWKTASHPTRQVALPPFTAKAHLWDKAVYQVELTINYTGIHRTCTISVSQTHPHTDRTPAVDTVAVWPPDQMWADVVFMVETYVGKSGLHLPNLRTAWMEVFTKACAYEAQTRYQSLRDPVQEGLLLRIA